MAGKTVTRADLCEAVYQKVGLSRTESATLVEMVLKEITDSLERGETVKLSSFGSFVVRKKGQRIGRNPKTGKEVPISPRRVMVFKPSAILKQRINSDDPTPIDFEDTSGGGKEDQAKKDQACRTGVARGGEGARRIPHHQRSGGRSECSAACAAVLGKPFQRNQADEARWRPSLLPPGRCRPPARHQAPALWRGLYDPRGAAHPQGSGPAICADGLAARRCGDRGSGIRGCRL